MIRKETQFSDQSISPTPSFNCIDCKAKRRLDEKGLKPSNFLGYMGTIEAVAGAEGSYRNAPREARIFSGWGQMQISLLQPKDL